MFKRLYKWWTTLPEEPKNSDPFPEFEKLNGCNGCSLSAHCGKVLRDNLCDKQGKSYEAYTLHEKPLQQQQMERDEIITFVKNGSICSLNYINSIEELEIGRFITNEYYKLGGMANRHCGCKECHSYEEWEENRLRIKREEREAWEQSKEGQSIIKEAKRQLLIEKEMNSLRG